MVTEIERKNAYEEGVTSAKTFLAESENSLLMTDEFCNDELSTALAMGWNSVWASEENRQRWAKQANKKST